MERVTGGGLYGWQGLFLSRTHSISSSRRKFLPGGVLDSGMTPIGTSPDIGNRVPCEPGVFLATKLFYRFHFALDRHVAECNYLYLIDNMAILP